MKTFTLSKKDLSYLGPLDASMSAFNVAIQVYVINTVFKRLAIDPKTQARYDLEKGELYVMEEKDIQAAQAKQAPVAATPAPETPAPEAKKEESKVN